MAVSAVIFEFFMLICHVFMDVLPHFIPFSVSLCMLYKYDSVKVLPVYESNPFDVDLNDFSKTVLQKRGVIDDFTQHSTGEVMHLVSNDKYHEFIQDSGVFTKLFRGKYVPLAKVLSMPSIHLLFFLFDIAKRNCNYVDVVDKDFFDAFGYSDNSRKVFLKAVLELCNNGVIAKCAGHKNRYWININIFINGNRMAYINKDDVVRVKRKVQRK